MLNRAPSKPCKLCHLEGHFPFQCRLNPKKIIQRSQQQIQRSPIKRSTTPLKRSRIKPGAGKHHKQWLIIRATWIQKNPPPIREQFWTCYLQIHEWCPIQLNINSITLDHVVSRSRDPSLRYNLENLRPACIYCNEKKGSRSLDQVKPPAE